MDLANNNSSALEIGNAGTAGAGRARFVAGILIVVAVTAIVANAVIAESRGNIGPATQTDPLVGPAAIEFRAGEQALTSTKTDPLLGPAAIEFRAGEQGLTSTQTDPLLGPAAIEFRASEHEGAAR